MKKIIIGILAHVDAGKTTLSEAMLFLSGKIAKLGRVDKKDAYLDTYDQERARGITIFSKQAIFEIGDMQITLMDTPGHVDFSTEMERTLRVLDYAILVISGADGVQGHTKTLWRLLDRYNIPVFIFVNKMDQNGTDKETLIDELKKQLNDGCVEFEEVKTENFYEQVVMCDESLMEAFFKTGKLEPIDIKKCIKDRKLFPCFFGSELKLEGVDRFMQGLGEYIAIPSYPNEFGAKIFKVTTDEQGNRLTHMKITGGKLKVKDVLEINNASEKVNQIRIYSGQKFETTNEIEAGAVCAVQGLSLARPGEVLGRVGLGNEGFGSEELGNEGLAEDPILKPVMYYKLILPEACEPRVILPKLRQLEDEDPQLQIVWDEKLHVILSPGHRGSGLVFENKCSEDILGKSWQRLVLQNLKEIAHKGVLTGAEITDLKITLVSGRAHNMHTQGGDFREAVRRAVRQGLMQAKSVLLEPYYSFQLELPEQMIGRAMTDIDKMKGTCEITNSDGEILVLEGHAPVQSMRNYQKEVTAYSKGAGKLFCSLKGYEICHNAEAIIKDIDYNPERDVENPTSSVFCSHGTGFIVNWDKVKDYMHLENIL